MADALLVPIHIDALLVNAQVASGVSFERWSNQWSNLNLFQNPIPPPWGSTAPAAPGVHLHWQLPAALTHGAAPADSSSAVFPYTPNRWLIVRLTSPVQGSAAQTATAWVLESDYLDPNHGSTPFVNPASTGTNIQTTLLGRNIPVAQYSGEVFPDGELFLTATGIAQTSFLAYQPGLVDVYSFVDDTTALPNNTCVTYLVAGWYSNVAFDPVVMEPDFANGIFTKLNWQVLGLSGDTPPNRSVFHGMVNDLMWQTGSIPARADSNARSMQVALGYTAIDALAAVLTQSDKGASPTPEQLEMMLAAFQYDCLHLLDEPDATAQLELRIREAWFGATPGGTLWGIVPVAQGQATPDPLSPTAQPAPAPLTPEQATWLAALNTTQRGCDVAARELRTLQGQLFALWWKEQYASTNYTSGLPNSGVNVTAMLTALANQLDSTQPTSFFSQVAAKQKALQQLLTTVPDPTSRASIEKYSQQIPGNTGTLELKANALPAFAQPADPVLLVAGITPPAAAPDKSQPWPCRVVSAAVTGVNALVNGQAVAITASSGKLPGIVPQPGNIMANGKPLGSLLDPSVATAVAALATEAFFADPNNATSIALNGIANSDPAVIAALQAGITNATAEIATIPDPLRARYAFALWQQAWTPLYVEWNLQFYPTVDSSFTGQQLPPPSLLASGAQAVQDNLPMDLAHWQFDGSDNVFARGSEYYKWAGGNIWAPPDSWLTPQTFQGRSALTPNAETLFLGRLKEFIRKQPVASASAVVTGGAVSAVNLISGGAGYGAAPAVTLSGGGGSGAAATAQVEGGVIIGITVTNGGAGYTAPPQVAIGPTDWAAIQQLIDGIGETRFLSQTLSGFNLNCGMKVDMHTVAMDAATAAVVAGEDRGVPNPSLGSVPILFGQGQPFFFPVRGGFFFLNQLQIVDGFGQVLDLLTANGNTTGSAASFQPILGAGLVPDPGLPASMCQVKQAPRLVQPSRLNLRWLDSNDDNQEVFLTAGANPVCGWLIPNHLDHSIAVYDAGGVALGELAALMQTSGSDAVVWLPAPGSPGSVPDPSKIQNSHLRETISAFTAQQGGIPVAQRVDAFRAWFKSIDETLWTVDPPGGQTDRNLAVLIGRPLAVVRLQVAFELYGRPSYNQSWRDTFDLANPNDPSTIQVGQQEAGFTAVPFPIQLGSAELLDDGLIGYFTGDTYTSFNAVHAASTPASPYIQALGGSNVLALPFNYPTYSSQNLTAVIDPLGTIHATTGTLPVQEVQLPAQFYAEALAEMAVSFRIGPILADPRNIRLNVPSEQRGGWSWVWQPAPGQYETDPIVAADAQARLGDAPPHLMDGWLLLTPSKPKQ